MNLAEIISSTNVGLAFTRLSGWRSLGARLASHRASARMSIGAVEKHSGVRWLRIREIENGCPVAPPPRDTELMAICQALCIERTAILEQADAVRRNR